MTCPICAKEAVSSFRPFCSKRCADLDLGRWLTGGYSIEGPPSEGTDRDEEVLPPGFPHSVDPS